MPPAQAQSSFGLNLTTTTHVQGSLSPLPDPGTQSSQSDWLDPASKALLVAFQGPVESEPGLCLSLFPLPHHVCVSEHNEAQTGEWTLKDVCPFYPYCPGQSSKADPQNKGHFPDPSLLGLSLEEALLSQDWPCCWYTICRSQ